MFGASIAEATMRPNPRCCATRSSTTPASWRSGAPPSPSRFRPSHGRWAHLLQVALFQRSIVLYIILDPYKAPAVKRPYRPWLSRPRTLVQGLVDDRLIMRYPYQNPPGSGTGQAWHGGVVPFRIFLGLAQSVGRVQPPARDSQTKRWARLRNAGQSCAAHPRNITCAGTTPTSGSTCGTSTRTSACTPRCRPLCSPALMLRHRECAREGAPRDAPVGCSAPSNDRSTFLL